MAAVCVCTYVCLCVCHILLSLYLCHGFSGKGFDNNVLGIAPVGAMCSSINAGLTTLRTNPLASATTAAHELGHMFGLDHDGGLLHRLTMHR